LGFFEAYGRTVQMPVNAWGISLRYSDETATSVFYYFLGKSCFCFVQAAANYGACSPDR
jgi:hypothetical protein